MASEIDTTERLLDAVEQLVAERGVEAVSLRSVNAAADANVAAVHYHFGSKRALVRAALDRRMGVLAGERAAMIDAIAADDTADDRRDREIRRRQVAEAFALPFLRFGRRPEGRCWVGLLAALASAGPDWSQLAAEAFAPQWERLAPHLRRAYPSLTERELTFRAAAAGAVLMGPAIAPDAPHESEVVTVVMGVFAAPGTAVDVVKGTRQSEPPERKRA